MHCVQVEALCCPSLDWGGHSLLQIFLMTQSLDASVSSLMYVRLIGKSVFWCRILFFSFCTTVLNSTGWNSFLTSCPLCLLAELLLCVQYIFYIWVLLLLDSQIWQRLSTNTSCPQGKFPLILPCFWTGSALSLYGYLPSLSSKIKGDRHCLPITQAQSNSFKSLLKLQ